MLKERRVTTARAREGKWYQDGFTRTLLLPPSPSAALHKKDHTIQKHNTLLAGCSTLEPVVELVVELVLGRGAGVELSSGKKEAFEKSQVRPPFDHPLDHSSDHPVGCTISHFSVQPPATSSQVPPRRSLQVPGGKASCRTSI